MIKEINKICFTQELSRPYYVRRKNNSPVLPFSTLAAKPMEAQAADELTWNRELLASSTTRSILTLVRQTQSLFQFSKLVFNEIMGNEQIWDSIALKKEPWQLHRCSVFLPLQSCPNNRFLTKNVWISNTDIITVTRPCSAVLLQRMISANSPGSPRQGPYRYS